METIIFKTLLHSLWQGLILALITAMILIFTGRLGARLRYNLLISALMLFTVGICASFAYEWQQFSERDFNGGQVVASPLQPVATGQSITTAGAEAPTAMIQQWLQYFNGYAPTIVLIWFLVICARSIQLFAGLYSIKRIRNTQISPAGVYWEDRVKALALQFGIAQVVQIVQSGIVKVPMVVGHLKPLILIPVGLINGLSAKEVEAIICHELAHIKRRDYLVNILQSLMEIIFFFNPAVLWISKLIREERESCCDDMTISNTNDKVNYISALISCQEFQGENPQYAMAVSGSDNHLVQRVKRMVSNDNPGLNKIEKGILAVGLVAAVTLTAAFSGASHTLKEPKNNVALQDTLRTKKKLSNSRIQTSTSTRVEEYLTKEIPEDKQAALRDREASLRDREARLRDQNTALNDRKAYENDRLRNVQDERLAENEKLKSEQDRLKSEQDRLKEEQDRLKVEVDVKLDLENKKQMSDDREVARTRSTTSTSTTRTTTKERENQAKNRKVTVKTGITADYLNKGEFDDNTSNYITDDLLKDGLIWKNEKLSFKIDKNEFIVNGKVLPENTRKKYAKKYLKRPDWILVYNYEVQ